MCLPPRTEHQSTALTMLIKEWFISSLILIEAKQFLLMDNEAISSIGIFKFPWLSKHCTFIKYPGPRFNIKMTSYQYRTSHYGDKTILRPSYLHNGISYAGKMTSLYWIRALFIFDKCGCSLAVVSGISEIQIWFKGCDRHCYYRAVTKVPYF